MGEKSEADRRFRIYVMTMWGLLGLGCLGFLYVMWAFGAFNFPPLPAPVVSTPSRGFSVHPSGSSVLMLTPNTNFRSRSYNVYEWSELTQGSLGEISISPSSDHLRVRFCSTGKEHKVFVADFARLDEGDAIDELHVLDFSSDFEVYKVPDVDRIISFSDTMHEVFVQFEDDYFRISLRDDDIARVAVEMDREESWIFASMVDEYDNGNAVIGYTADFFLVTHQLRTPTAEIASGEVLIVDQSGKRLLTRLLDSAWKARISEEHNMIALVSEIGEMRFLDTTRFKLVKFRRPDRPRDNRVVDLAFAEDRGHYYTFDSSGDLRKRRLHR